MPVAFIVVKAGATVAAQTVIDHCIENLTKFKVPKLVRQIDSLPRTPSGKVMKRDLRALLQEEQKVKP